MTEKGKWLVKIACVVLVICSLALIITTNRDKRKSTNNVTPALSSVESVMDPQPSPVEEHLIDQKDAVALDVAVAVTDIESEDRLQSSRLPIYSDKEAVDNYMTWDEIQNLSQGELEFYLSQVEWDDNFQVFIDSDPETHNDKYYYEKLYLQMNEDYYIPGFGNPYAEVEPAAPEDDRWTQWTSDAEAALYDSSPVSYVFDDKGNTITVGWEGETSGKALCIVPTCSYADSEHKVAFYIMKNSKNLVFSRDMAYGTTTSTFNLEYNNFIISHQTYNFLYASTYNFEEDLCRVKWVDAARYNGQLTEEETIYGRAIDLNTGDLLACFRIDVRYDRARDCYYLADIYDSNATETGDLTVEERNGAVQDAIDFLTANEDLSVYLPTDDWEAIAENAIVEKLPPSETYFPQLYDTDLNVIYASDITYYITDIYAVNLPVTGMGFITFYFAPELSVLYAFEPYPGTPPSDLNLTMFGFDAFTPFSATTILSLDGYVTAF